VLAIPNQVGGPFFSVLSRIIVLFICVVLFLSELGGPRIVRKFFELSVPVYLGHAAASPILTPPPSLDQLRPLTRPATRPRDAWLRADVVRLAYSAMSGTGQAGLTPGSTSSPSIAATVLSGFVPLFLQVSGWFLFVIGCYLALVSLLQRRFLSCQGAALT
jgi:hypothetical protein